MKSSNLTSRTSFPTSGKSVAMRALLMMRKIPPARLLTVPLKDLRELNAQPVRPDPLVPLEPREKPVM
jgi:hypothetical protein